MTLSWIRACELRSGVLLLLVLATASCESYESQYRTLADAERARSIERGWIPPKLPSSARDIREWHDLDTNRGFGRLSFDQADETWVRQHFDPISTETQLVLEPRSGDPDWWPSLLQGRFDQAKLNQQGIVLYEAAEFTFAVDNHSRTLYFWQGARVATPPN